MSDLKSLAYATATPKFMYICPTNVCNYKCGVCARKDVMRKKLGYMDFELFKKIVDDLPKSIETIYLHKQGESTLHPKLPEMMRYLKTERPDIKLKLNTNASKLSPEIIHELVKYLDVLTVSMWSIEPSTYHQVHGVDKFNKVIDNIDQILSIKEETGSLMELWIEYVNHSGNKDETDEEVLKFFNKRYSDITVSYWWTVNFMGLGKEGNLQIYDKLEYSKFPYCIFPWISLTVTWDGYIDYCFVDPKEIEFLGDLNKQKISDVWNNDKYISFRENFLLKNFDALENNNISCRKCNFIWSMQTQNFEDLKDKDLKDVFIENQKNNEKIWEEYLNQEGKSLKDFYGYRKKI